MYKREPNTGKTCIVFCSKIYPEKYVSQDFLFMLVPTLESIMLFLDRFLEMDLHILILI